jgi:hypothetical protein
MDRLLQSFLLSITIIIAAIIGLWRYRKTDIQYRPFIWLCCLISLNEILRFILLKMKIYSYANYNLALPVTCYLYLLQFKRWGLFAGKKYLFQLLYGLLLAIWLWEHLILSNINVRTNYFRVCNSLSLVIMAVTFINNLIISEKKSLFTNSRFIICAALVIYYTYRIIVDAFIINGMSKEFLEQLGDFNRYLLVGFNLLSALAVLWIPTKKNYTIRF